MYNNLVKRVILVTYISCCDIIIMSCSYYIWYSVKCWVSYNSKKCDKCVCYNVCYNVSDSKLSNWSQLNCEQEKIHSALAETKSIKNKICFYIYYLKKQKELLNCCKDEMIYHDLKLLKELKCIKTEETVASVINQDYSDSSTDVFNFLESDLTSVKWLSFWLKLVSFNNTV